MEIKVKRLSEPANEPLSIQEVKLFLRLPDSTTEDDLLNFLIKAARIKAEQLTGRSLGLCDWAIYTDIIPAKLKLIKSPFSSLTSVQYKKDDVWTDFTDYVLDDQADPAVLIIADADNYSFENNSVNNFKVEYKAGYDVVPEPIKHWMLVNIATWYEMREKISETSINELPRTFVDYLLDDYKVRLI